MKIKINKKQTKLMTDAGFVLDEKATLIHEKNKVAIWTRGKMRIAFLCDQTPSLDMLVQRVVNQAGYLVVREYRQNVDNVFFGKSDDFGYLLGP